MNEYDVGYLVERAEGEIAELSPTQKQALAGSIENSQTKLDNAEFNELCQRLEILVSAKALILKDPVPDGGDRKALEQASRHLNKFQSSIDSLSPAALKIFRGKYDFFHAMESVRRGPDDRYFISYYTDGGLTPIDVLSMIVDFTQQQLAEIPVQRGRKPNQTYYVVIWHIVKFVTERIPWMTISHHPETPFYRLIYFVLVELFDAPVSDAQRHIKNVLDTAQFEKPQKD